MLLLRFIYPYLLSLMQLYNSFANVVLILVIARVAFSPELLRYRKANLTPHTNFFHTKPDSHYLLLLNHTIPPVSTLSHRNHEKTWRTKAIPTELKSKICYRTSRKRRFAVRTKITSSPLFYGRMLVLNLFLCSHHPLREAILIIIHRICRTHQECMASRNNTID